MKEEEETAFPYRKGEQKMSIRKTPPPATHRRTRRTLELMGKGLSRNRTFAEFRGYLPARHSLATTSKIKLHSVATHQTPP